MRGFRLLVRVDNVLEVSLKDELFGFLGYRGRRGLLLERSHGSWEHSALTKLRLELPENNLKG